MTLGGTIAFCWAQAAGFIQAVESRSEVDGRWSTLHDHHARRSHARSERSGQPLPPNPPRIPKVNRAVFTRLLERRDSAPVVYGPEDQTLAHDPAAIAFEELPGVWLVNSAIHADCSTEASTPRWDCGFAFRVTSAGQHYRLWIDSSGRWSLSLSGSGLIDSGVYEPSEAPSVDLFVIDTSGYLGIDGVFVTALDLSDNQETGRVAIGTGFSAETATAGTITRFTDVTVRNPGDLTTSLDAEPSASGATILTMLRSTAEASDPLFGPGEGFLEHDPDRTTLRSPDLTLAIWSLISNACLQRKRLRVPGIVVSFSGSEPGLSRFASSRHLMVSGRLPRGQR